MKRKGVILKMAAFWAVILSLILYSTVIFGATIHVPGDYATIQAGIDAASNGDTVLVGPDTYVENISFRDKGLVIMSTDGPGSNVIDGNGGKAFDIYLGGGGYVELRGLSITNSDWAIHGSGNNGVFQIADSYFYLNNVSISGTNHVSFGIVNCLVIQSEIGFQQTYYGNNSSIINSTFADNNTDISYTPGYSTNSELNIVNSILKDQITGTGDNPVYLDYCNYDPTKLGTDVTVQEGCQTENPLFVDQINSDFHLQPGSPCINNGDPNAFYNDPDGTRNDIGYTGGSNLFVNTGSLVFGYVAIGKTKELPLVIHNGKDTDIILSALYLGSPQLSTTARFPLTISFGSDETNKVRL